MNFRMNHRQNSWVFKKRRLSFPVIWWFGSNMRKPLWNHRFGRWVFHPVFRILFNKPPSWNSLTKKKSCHSGFPYPQPPHLFNTSISPVKIITSHNFQICSRTMSVCLCVCVYHVFSWAKWHSSIHALSPLPVSPQRKNYIDYITAKVSQNLLFTLARKVYNFQRLGLAAP